MSLLFRWLEWYLFILYYEGVLLLFIIIIYLYNTNLKYLCLFVNILHECPN